MYGFKKRALIVACLLASVGLWLGILHIYDHRNHFLYQTLRIPSTSLGPPKGYVYAKVAHEKDYIPLMAGNEKKYSSFPFANTPYANATLFPELFTGFIQFPEVYIVKLDEGRVFGCDGVVVTSDDKILADTAIHLHCRMEDHKAFRKKKLSKVCYLDETVAVVASRSTDCYYHWMFDVLPRLEILKRSHISYDKIYLNPLKFSFQKETFKLLGLDEKKIIWSDSHQHICAKTLIVPSIPGGKWTMPPPWVCDYLKEKFLKSPLVFEKKRIYIPRKGTRKILNEQQLLSALEKLGFEEVLLEKLSVREQAELFASAECIVTPHGAGLTNLVFCNEGTCLLEIFTPDHLNPCFWYLGQERHLKHVCLMGNQEGLTNEEKKNKDIYVNVDEIMAQLATWKF